MARNIRRHGRTNRVRQICGDLSKSKTLQQRIPNTRLSLYLTAYGVF